MSQIHREIQGNWYYYLLNKHLWSKFRARHSKGRVDVHDIWCTDPANAGIYPFREEIEYASPKQNQSEDLFISGSNVGDQNTIEIYFKRRPLQRTSPLDLPKDRVEIKFKLDDGKGNVYWMDEATDSVDFNPREYRGSGFAFESLHANKIGRIKFRGYLKLNNDNNKLYYVQILFLTLFFSKTFDHQRIWNEKFIAKELSTRRVEPHEELLEDKIEQFCQIKGTFKVEAEDEQELFFLGSVGRRFLPKTKMEKRKVIKIGGFTQDGVGFQIGLVSGPKLSYRYGFLFHGFDNLKLIEELSVTKREIEFEILKSDLEIIQFYAKFQDDENKIHKFQIIKYKDNQRLLKLDGVDGLCIVDDRIYDEIESPRENPNDNQEFSSKLVVSLEDSCSRIVNLTGGKGGSLAQLNHLAKSNSNLKFTVPNALIVTCSAYSLQTNSISDFSNQILNLEDVTKSSKTKPEIEKACKSFVEWFSNQTLNDSIKKDISQLISSEFGSTWNENPFAVRSSAALEDSSEMSAAGQMTTYLGVRGLENIYQAVIKCWASQFAFVPIEYKRGYGQALDQPMAVVIQEMIDCDCAGVIFTVNPIDGDERLLTVTSNFGLGESVVSAAADPDTFQLAVQVRANSYEVDRAVESIVSKTLGKKSLVTRLNSQVQDNQSVESGVLNEISSNGEQSVSDEDLMRLGNVALKIQQHYNNPRDIEWGIKRGRLYIFQSRPITNLDSNFLSYELMHEMDSPHVSELELYSRSHWAQVYPGSCSWPSGFFLLNGFTSVNAYKMGMMNPNQYNPFRANMGYINNQLMFNMRSGPFIMMFRDYPRSAAGVEMVMAMFGRHITDPDFLQAIDENSAKLSKQANWKVKLLFPIGILYMLFFACKKIPALERQVFEDNILDMMELMRKRDFKDKLEAIFLKIQTHFNLNQVHGASGLGSPIKLMFLKKLLNSASDDGSHVEEDVNLLMSHCNDVISAEVPEMMRQVAQAIGDKDKFLNLSDEEALQVLTSKTKSSEPQAAKLFEAFIAKHGHRGYREFDFLYPPWSRAPLPCVQVIKSMAKPSSYSTLDATKEQKSLDEIMSELKTPLEWFKKLLLKKWFLPQVQDAVGYRERTKSMMIKFHDEIRKAFWHIAQEMVERGILPEADLFFYLKLNEIKQLTGGERDPLLVIKAKQRKRIYPTMDKMKFDEFLKGFRMQPKPAKKEMIRIDLDAVQLKGTPVTVGSIKARVCVAESIEEAVNIQQGDILITYATDIGWSPYFAMLTGIVTEIGGTISHGAVIAREYGIPCLISVENACEHFKTGDIAYLDTKTASIVRVIE